MNKYFYHIIILILIIFSFSCEKEKFNTSVDAKLVFSQDTIMFDTIFTSIGSTTKKFTVKNPYDHTIQISSVYLANGDKSPFRLNIDGNPGNRLNNIELRGKDSLYIFVEVTIDPNNSALPLAINDSIIFSFNNKQQDIDLLAWGQDVNLINGQLIQTQTWDSDKPYLIYNSMMVDKNHILNIKPGTILYFHKSSRLFVAGTIIANGTLESPVIFQGDRLEEYYDDIPGQWDGIWLMAGSKDNVFNYTEIKNAIIGIQADTLQNKTNPTLLLSNSKIINMTSIGIWAQGSTIKAYNNLIANCGQFAVALTIGGEYEFYHCTIANYWGYSTRTTPSVLLTNYYIDIDQNTQIRPMEKALFANCIIYGNKETEFIIDKNQAGALNYKLDHCLLKLDEEFTIKEPEFEKVIINQDPEFIDQYDGKFALDTLSAAKDKGKPEYGLIYTYDINMINRNLDAGPDIGAFERSELN